MSNRFIAIDLGAESGRVIVGTLTDGRVQLDVMHRFANGPITVDGTLRWDLPALFDKMKTGLRAAFAQYGTTIRSIGVDTWGVDYGLTDEQGQLLELPYCYRDRRTDGLIAEFHRDLSEPDYFLRTGVRPMAINTVYQLLAHRRHHPQLFTRAIRLLTIPDIFHGWLSGVFASEWSFAATTGLALAGKREWDATLIAKLDLPPGLFQPIIAPGTCLGVIRADLAAELGISHRPMIVVPASHDTASAVAASPGDAARTAYLSSGTWSLIGTVIDHPLTSQAALQAACSNELAHDGRTRLNHNIMGLWLVQECRRAFIRAGHERSYAELADMAAAVPASKYVLDVNDQRFVSPGSANDEMPARIRLWCNEHGKVPPADDAALVRLILDGLATAYARGLHDLQRLSGRRIEALHILGGGCQHAFLNQLTADACGVPVIAGPVEATALGNVLVQAKALGVIDDITATLQRSVQVDRYEPRGRHANAHS